MTMMIFHNAVFCIPSALGALRTACDVHGGSGDAVCDTVCESDEKKKGWCKGWVLWPKVSSGYILLYGSMLIIITIYI